MKDLRSTTICRALLLVALAAALPTLCAAQAAPAGSRPPGTSRFDLYGGYTYIHPFNSDIYNVPYQPLAKGAITSIAGYFTPHLGVQAEGGLSPHGPNDCFYSAQAGPIYRWQFGRLVPFAHALFGGARVGGPTEQPCTWGYGATIGLGADYILPNPIFQNRLAIRPIQADFVYSHVNYGPQSAPNIPDGGIGQITAYRLSAGIVFRLGQVSTPYPAQYGCTVNPVAVYPGEPVTVTGQVIDLDTGKNFKPVYTWQTSGGKIEGNTETATVTTAGLAPGDYKIIGRIDEGRGQNRHAQCITNFSVLAFQPPTISCSANPSTILPGGFSTITAQGTSPENRPLTYSYSTTAGQITGNGTTGALSAANVGPGVITVTCNAVDNLGHSAATTVTVTVVTPPAPPAPLARNLCSVSFERDRRRPERVDNEAKACLDDIALELNRHANAVLVVVGNHDPNENPMAAAARTLNIKQYLTQEKGIDPARIELRTGLSTARSADDILVPPGATWDPSGTTSFDPARVVRHGEPYAPPQP